MPARPYSLKLMISHRRLAARSRTLMSLHIAWARHRCLWPVRCHGASSPASRLHSDDSDWVKPGQRAPYRRPGWLTGSLRFRLRVSTDSVSSFPGQWHQQAQVTDSRSYFFLLFQVTEILEILGYYVCVLSLISYHFMFFCHCYHVTLIFPVIFSYYIKPRFYSSYY